MAFGKHMTDLLKDLTNKSPQAAEPAARQKSLPAKKSVQHAIDYKKIVNSKPPIGEQTQRTRRTEFKKRLDLIQPPGQLDLQRCVEDFEYYAANLLKIKTITSELVPFVFNRPQRLFYDCLQKLKKKGRLARIIVLKARREGISTISEGLIFHAAHMNENTEAVVISHEKDSGDKIFAMCRLFYDCLPPKLRPMTKYENKKQLVFANGNKKTKDIDPGLRSSIEVITAGKKDVARSAGYHLLHCSELSSWPFPDEVISGLVPTIPKTPDSLIIYESTAKGVGNFFHQEWERAENGESNFTPFFLSWFDMPEYTFNFYSPEERLTFIEKLNEEEKELQANFMLTPEQLYWRRITIADLKGDVELFRQENPSTPEEAFIVSGVPVFDRKKLRLMSQKTSEPKFRGEIGQTNNLEPNDLGRLRLWEPPQKGQVYSIGVDVADGGEGGDFSCIEVWKKLHTPYTAEQVAEWHGHIDPYNLAHVAAGLGKFYHEALIGVETNAHGLATLNELQKTYWNLYRQEYFDRYKNSQVNKLGWETTNRSKKLLISFMTHCIQDLSIIIHSKDLIREGMTFLRNAQGTADAASGGHDDRIMAAMVGLFVMHQQLEEPEEAGYVEPVKDSRIIVPQTQAIDPEFQMILEYGSQDVYDATWMNY